MHRSDRRYNRLVVTDAETWQPLATLLPAWLETFDFTLADAILLQHVADDGGAGDTSTRECKELRATKGTGATISLRVDHASKRDDLTHALRASGWSTHDLNDDTAWFSRTMLSRVSR